MQNYFDPGGMQNYFDPIEWVFKITIMTCIIAIIGIVFVLAPLDTFGVLSEYESYQGTVREFTYPMKGSGITMVIGFGDKQKTVTFQKDIEAVCALEVGHTYWIKTVTTYHKTRLYSYEELPPLSPCPQEVSP